MNYTELSAQIQAFTENDFPVTTGSVVSADQIAQFVKNAEQRIYNTVQLPSLRKNVTGTATAGNKYLACPSDFLAVYSMAVIDALGDYHNLLNKDVNFLREAYPNPTTTGLPRVAARQMGLPGLSATPSSTSQSTTLPSVIDRPHLGIVIARMFDFIVTPA